VCRGGSESEREEKKGIVTAFMERERDKMNLFTDGSVGEGQKGGGAACVYYKDGEKVVRKRATGRWSNSRAI